MVRSRGLVSFAASGNFALNSPVEFRRNANAAGILCRINDIGERRDDFLRASPESRERASFSLARPRARARERCPYVNYNFAVIVVGTSRPEVT